jgi:putative membrane protein
MSVFDRRRKPAVFDADDPDLVRPEPEAAAGTPIDGKPPAPEGKLALPTRADVARGFRWGTLLVASMASLAALAASLSFARFVSIALARDDWLGWLAAGLLALGLLAALVLIGRELVGLLRLARLGRLRKEAETALARRDLKLERSAAGRLASLLAGRPELAWGVARFREHQRDVRDAGELIALADRELIAPLDAEARRLVFVSAKRVATVTAISPMALIAVGYVLIENLRLMRRLAALYGGRPGFLGALRLAGRVVGHMIATGGVAMTDDLLGQFLGQDLLRRLSRRLGEGAFNGALTARVGAAAIEVTRPLPFIEASPVRARDIVKELFRRSPGEPPAQP